jgi:hypothetical protein
MAIAIIIPHSISSAITIINAIAVVADFGFVMAIRLTCSDSIKEKGTANSSRGFTSQPALCNGVM